MSIRNEDSKRYNVPIFNNYDLDAQVDFTIGKGNTIVERGLANHAIYIDSQRQCCTTYSVKYPSLTTLEIYELTAALGIDDPSTTEVISNSVRSIFPFDDFSDNFMFPWATKDNFVQQYGVLVPVALNTFRIVKVYQVGGQRGYRVAHSWHPTAEIKVNNTILTPGERDDVNGLVIGAFDAFDPVSTDHYYTSVRLEGDLAFQSLRATGFPWRILKNNSNPLIDCPNRQIYSLAIQLKEATTNNLNVKLPFLHTNNTTVPFTVVDVRDYAMDAQLSFKPRVKEWNHRTYKSVTTSSLEIVPTTNVFTPQEVKHRELILWTTMFRATGGGAIINA